MRKKFKIFSNRWVEMKMASLRRGDCEGVKVIKFPQTFFKSVMREHRAVRKGFLMGEGNFYIDFV